MPFALVLLLAAGIALPDPLALTAVRNPAALEITFELAVELPEELTSSLESGAEVRLTYPLRVRAKRRGWWDRKVWSGELATIAAFDAVTGRYRCQVILDGVITESDEVETADAARSWLTTPPPVHVELPLERRLAHLKVRVRAVFSSGTTWLIFPTQDATPWVEIDLQSPDDAADTE
jgi:hypothetical protein